jgi:uncharacterized protein (TIGR03435 family)
MRFRAALLALIVAAALAQPLSFEVVSVKPSSSAGGAAPGTNDPGAFSAHGMTLKLLMTSAYDVLYAQVGGGPGWADSDRFDVDAKAGGAVTEAQKMDMLGSLLADRFHLKFHREPGTLRAYALVVAKDGLKIHPVKAGDPAPAFKPGMPAFRMSLKRFAAFLNVYISRGGEFPAPGAPPLTPLDPLPVIDATDLSGDYDIYLDMTRSRDWSFVLEQTGLKLEPRKVSIQMLIIDSAAKPAAN